MADYTINNIDELFTVLNSFTEANKGSHNVYIEKDIDFNDDSRYWYNQSTLFTIRFADFRQTINIFGNGHSIKNIYLVNGRIFEAYGYGSGDCNQTVNFYDINFDFCLNRNPVETNASLGFAHLDGNTTSDARQIKFMFYNCTFRSKLFLGSNINQYSARALFTGRGANNNYEFFQFTNCIFNIEYYRISFRGITDNYSLSDTASPSTVIINSQFYIKLYLTDAYLEATNMNSFLWHKVHNTFFVLDIRACNSRYFHFCYDTNCVLSNTYIVIKKTNKTLTQQPTIRFNCSSDSSANNFITLDSSVTTNSIVINNNNSSKLKSINNSNAKDADYLIENVGFTIKGE